MKILGISGSPRKDGNAGILLRETLQAVERMDCAPPVYFGNVTAQLKAVMDRTFVERPKGALKGKVTGVFTVTRRVDAVQSKTLINSFCIAHGMIVAGGVIGYGREPGNVLTGTGGGIK